MDEQIIAERYHLQTELGAGGMGTVYKGIDIQTNVQVAIKQLKPHLTDTTILERFQREGQALRELDHPNIVKMLAMVEDQGTHYLVMELVSGGDLRDLLLQQHQLAAEKCVDMALDLADALTRAHRLGIIHRDLKPANVLITEDGTLKLTDFGIAHVKGQKRVTDTDAIVGTIAYLAPEILNGDDPDDRADIWAFGVMLFELLSGKHPFEGNTITETITNILTQPLPDLEDLSPDAPIALVDLVYRMLERDPQARISSVRHVGAALEDILHGRDTTPPPARFDTPQADYLYRPKHNLPVQTTPFVGRESELSDLGRLLSDNTLRLITVLAPGGMGKTRIALKAAEQHLDSFENGVYFVELAPLANHDNIASAIADSVGYQFQADGREPKQQLFDFLRQKTLLLVLDNFEHLLAGASVITEILNAAPAIQILATSRQRLSQAGETLFHLSGMEFPTWETPEDALEYAAVKLFLQSAKRAKPNFELTAANLDDVARICRLVQGMPLGIVLAASWLGMLTTAEVAQEIAGGIDFLETDETDLPERQRSIRAVMDYSWQQMSETEQQIFMKLSVFRGGFNREAAQAVTRANLRVLMSLVNKSLLRRDGDSGRYQIHELLRQYAAEQLKNTNTTDKTRDAHLSYYSEVMSKREADLMGARQVEAIADIKPDFENVKAAWRWSGERENHIALGLILGGITLFCRFTNHTQDALELLQEVEDWLHSAKELERLALRGRILLYQAQFGLSAGQDPQILLDRTALGLEIVLDCGSPYDIAFASYIMGFVTSRMNIWEESNLHLNKALRISREIKAELIEITTLRLLGYNLAVRGTDNEVTQARKYWMEAVKIGQKIGEKNVTAVILMNLGLLEMRDKHFEKAQTFYLESLTIRRQFEINIELLRVLSNLTELYMFQGKLNKAEALALEGLQVSKEINISLYITSCLITLSRLHILQENYIEAHRLINEADSMLKTGDDPLRIAELKVWHGITLFGVGEIVSGANHIYISLPMLVERGQITNVLTALFGMSLALAYHKNLPEIALEVASLAAHHPVFLFWHQNPLAQDLVAHLKKTLTPNAYETAWERGKLLDLENIVQKLLEEFGDKHES